jgi:uncharacterized OB-fold protein
VSGFSVSRDDASAPFFDAAGRGVLLIKRCPRCGGHLPPQATRCPDGDSLQWVEASGSASLVSWAVDHAPPLCEELGRPDGQASIFGIVQLDEGPWLQVAILQADAGDLSVGQPMRATFIRPGGGEAVPAFTPS